MIKIAYELGKAYAIKEAAPRWVKELSKNPKLLGSLFNLGDDLAISPFGKKVLSDISKSKISRSDLSKFMGGSIRSTLKEVPMSDPLKRMSYFKHNGKTYQVLPSNATSYLDSFSPSNIEHQKEVIKKYLSNPQGSDAVNLSRAIGAFKEVNPKGTIDIAHATNSNKLLDIIRSPSAISDKLPINTLFGHEANVGTPFYGRTKMFVSKVPKRNVIYQGSTSPGNPLEAVVPGDAFLRGFMPKRKLWHYHPDNPEMLDII